MRFMLNLMAALVLVMAPMAGIAQATSWAKLSPDEVTQRASIIVVGRVREAIPSQWIGEDLWNGLVLDVESYLGSRAGPARLPVMLPGGDACQGNRCVHVVGISGTEYVGKRLLILLGPRSDGVGLAPVGGPNGIVTLADEGLAVRRPTLDMTEQERTELAAWQHVLEISDQHPPDPTAAPVEIPPASPMPLRHRIALLPPGLAIGVPICAVSAMGVWFWFRRRK